MTKDQAIMDALAMKILLDERDVDYTNAVRAVKGMWNPYPQTMFPMTAEEYVAAIPDGSLRTAISGFLCRFAWDVCHNQVVQFLEEALPEEQDDE